MKVYGVSTYSWDGGGTFEQLYIDKNDAILYMDELVKKKNEEIKQMNADPLFEDDDEPAFSFFQKKDDGWTDGMVTYAISEFELNLSSANQTIQEFVTKIAANQKEIDPEINTAIKKRYKDL